MCAADAKALVDHSNATLKRRLFRQRQNFRTKQLSQAPHGLVATRRAEIYADAILDNSGSVRSAPRIAALGALCLRQQVIDLLDKAGRFRRQ
jgi:hypothetical protein